MAEGCCSSSVGVVEEKETVCDSIALSISRILQNCTEANTKQRILQSAGVDSCGQFRVDFTKRLESVLNRERRRKSAAPSMQLTRQDVAEDAKRAADSVARRCPLFNSLPVCQPLDRADTRVAVRKSHSASELTTNTVGRDFSDSDDIRLTFSDGGDLSNKMSDQSGFSNPSVNDKDERVPSVSARYGPSPTDSCASDFSNRKASASAFSNLVISGSSVDECLEENIPQEDVGRIWTSSSFSQQSDDNCIEQFTEDSDEDLNCSVRKKIPNSEFSNEEAESVDRNSVSDLEYVPPKCTSSPAAGTSAVRRDCLALSDVSMASI